MKEGPRFIRGFDPPQESFLPLLQLRHPVLQLRALDAIDDCVDDLLNLALDSLQLALRGGRTGTLLHPQPIHFLRELSAELLEEVVAQQLLLKCSQDALFHLPPPDRQQVCAGAAATCTEATQVLPRVRDEARAAFTALRQPGEQVLGPAELIETLAVRCRLPLVLHGGVSRLDAVPQFVVNDAELRDILRDPLAWWIHARDSLARIGILQEPLPVPDQAADVQLVVKDAVPSLRVAMNRARAPQAALWASHSFGIEGLCDLLGRGAGQIVLEDAPNDPGLPGDDLALPRRHDAVLETANDPVAEADAPARPACFDPATQTASGLLRQLLQEQGVHRPFEADVQVRDVAFCERDDVHAGEREALEQPGGVFLVAAEAIERFGHNDVDLLLQGFAHHRLEAGAHDRRT